MGYCSYRNPTVTQAPNGIELKRSGTHDHVPNMIENGRGVQKLFSDKCWTDTHTHTHTHTDRACRLVYRRDDIVNALKTPRHFATRRFETVTFRN